MLGWFRRHATVLMVVLGSAAMVIFGLGSVFNSWASSAGEQVYENPTIAEWKGGKLTEEDVGRVYRSHAESLRFLGAVATAAEAKLGDQVQPLAEPITPMQAETDQRRITSVVRRMMMAQAAKDQGFVVSDQMVTEYIALMSGDAQFNNADLEVINRKVNQTSLDIIKKHLKVELLAMQMGGLSSVGMNMLPNPTEAISLYGRTSEKIECEVLPIAVKDFMGEVSEKPSDSELRELYKEGKDDLPDPKGIKPGFKFDRKINVQYFVARADTFLKNEMNKITAKEVQEEYDRLVEKNDVRVLEPVVRDNSFVTPNLDDLPGMPDDSNPDNAPTPPTDGATPPADAPTPPADAPTPPADAPTPPADGDSEPSTDVPNPPSDSSDVPAVETPSTEANPKVELPNVDLPKVELPSVELPKVETPAAPESSHLIHGTRAQFVSTQDPVTDPPEAEPAAQTPEQGSSSTTEEADPKTGGQMDNQPPATNTDPVKLPQADAPQTGGIGADIEEELKKQEAAPERKYKPLTDVAETIKSSLAEPIADAKMRKALEQAKYDIDDYFSDLDIWENDNPKERGEKPSAPDFEALAKKHNLQLKQTGLVDREEMELTPFGNMQQRMRLGRKLQMVKLGNVVFAQARSLKLYEALVYESVLEPDIYVFWLSENDKPHVGDFKECKDQVTEFWTKQKAFELAKKEAESISNKVNDDRGSKLTELYPDRALQTGEFSWFDTLEEAALGKPGNVEKPSDDFMATAFSLNKLEAGVGVDRDRDTIYVIQSISGNLPLNELGADYLQNKFMTFKRLPSEVANAVDYYGGQEQRKANEALTEELGFEYDSDFEN